MDEQQQKQELIAEGNCDAGVGWAGGVWRRERDGVM